MLSVGHSVPNLIEIDPARFAVTTWTAVTRPPWCTLRSQTCLWPQPRPGTARGRPNLPSGAAPRLPRAKTYYRTPRTPRTPMSGGPAQALRLMPTRAADTAATWPPCSSLRVPPAPPLSTTAVRRRRRRPTRASGGALPAVLCLPLHRFSPPAATLLAVPALTPRCPRCRPHRGHPFNITVYHVNEGSYGAAPLDMNTADINGVRCLAAPDCVPTL